VGVKVIWDPEETGFWVAQRFPALRMNQPLSTQAPQGTNTP